jgi:hypothetical protein
MTLSKDVLIKQKSKISGLRAHKPTTVPPPHHGGGGGQCDYAGRGEGDGVEAEEGSRWGRSGCSVERVRRQYIGEGGRIGGSTRFWPKMGCGGPN